MARYDYHCPSCGLTFEVEHPMSERPKISCPDCGSEANQVFGASGIVFKGSGFYNTDQRKGATSSTPSTSKPAQAESSGSKSSGSKSSGSKSSGSKSSGSKGSAD